MGNNQGLTKLFVYIIAIFISVIAYCGNTFIQHLFSSDGSFGLFKGNVVKKGKLDEFDYIRDGLVHWYDSEINSGDRESHQDGKLLKWKDLIGGYDLSITDRNSLNFGVDNGLIAQSNRTTGICVANIPNDDCITIEICCAPLRSIDYLNETTIFEQDKLYTILAQGSNNGDVYDFAAPFFISYISEYNNFRKKSDGSRSSEDFIIARGEDYAWRVFLSSNAIFNRFFYYDYDTYNVGFATTTISVTNNDKSEINSNNVSNISYPYAYGWMKTCMIDFSPDESSEIRDTTYNTYKTTKKSNGIQGSASDIVVGNVTIKPDIEKIKIKENELQIGGTRYFDSATNKYVEENLFSGYIFCIRIYNRVLTDEEREHNADIDLNRFYKSWPDQRK